MQPPRPIDDQLYDTQVRQGIEECLEAVPGQQRMAFILREVQVYQDLKDKKLKRYISAGSAVAIALILYGLGYIPEHIWVQFKFIWLALLKIFFSIIPSPITADMEFT